MYNRGDPCLAPILFPIVENKAGHVIKLHHVVLRVVRIRELVIDARFTNRKHRSRTPGQRSRSVIVSELTSVVKIIHVPLVRHMRGFAPLIFFLVVCVEFMNENRQKPVNPVFGAYNCS